jgi:diguanylate cyclase (GGDEF)-like protein
MMKTDVDTVAPDSPIEAVVRKLSERRVSCVVVCDGGSPVGIVSPKDLVGAALEEHADARARTAAAVLSAPPLTIESTESAARAATEAMSHAIRQLPVVDANGSLVGLVGESELLSAYARRNAQLEELSTIDPVTSLCTRRHITNRLSTEWQRARRYDTNLTVLMADFDHFKQINDSYGHPAGDAVLGGVSALLLRTLRATDAAGRYGGEEVLAILSQSGLQDGTVVAERWREATQRACFRIGDDREISVTLSIGVASIRADHRTPDDLVGAADAMLYRAKESGRNRVVFDQG